MNLNEILDIIIIPITLALIAILWPEIQSWSRQRVFKRLILRELTEISPFPKKPIHEGWWQHCHKRFIHRELLQNVIENREFILSLNPDLVYFTTQLWQSLEEHNWDQWGYSFQELANKYDPTGKMSKQWHAWQTLYDEYQKEKLGF